MNPSLGVSPLSPASADLLMTTWIIPHPPGRWSRGHVHTFHFLSTAHTHCLLHSERGRGGQWLSNAFQYFYLTSWVLQCVVIIRYLIPARTVFLFIDIHFNWHRTSYILCLLSLAWCIFHENVNLLTLSTTPQSQWRFWEIRYLLQQTHTEIKVGIWCAPESNPNGLWRWLCTVYL